VGSLQYRLVPNLSSLHQASGGFRSRYYRWWRVLELVFFTSQVIILYKCSAWVTCLGMGGGFFESNYRCYSGLHREESREAGDRSSFRLRRWKTWYARLALVHPARCGATVLNCPGRCFTSGRLKVRALVCSVTGRGA
jgi:hypothetical protein